jgi:hypothetical protein
MLGEQFGYAGGERERMDWVFVSSLGMLGEKLDRYYEWHPARIFT